jgi:hypothetical protein
MKAVVLATHLMGITRSERARTQENASAALAGVHHFVCGRCEGKSMAAHWAVVDTRSFKKSFFRSHFLIANFTADKSPKHGRPSL